MSIEPTPEPEAPAGPFSRVRSGIRWLNANRKRFFWWWVTYQAVKGIITHTLIWVPLLILWLRSRGEA